MSEPLDFIIIGAQKSGTTTLHEVISEHPEVFMPPGKEHPILNKAGLNISEARHELADLFSAATGVRGKATPQYLASQSACSLLAELAPRVRIIAILRDPVERTFSHYRMVARRAGLEVPFDALIDTWLDPHALNAARLREHAPNEDELPFCVVWSEYGRMLAPWFERFGPEQILLLNLNALELQPASIYRTIFTFLDVDADWSSPSIGKVFHQGGDKALVDFQKVKRIPLLGPSLRWLHGKLSKDLKMKINTRNIRTQAKSARILFPEVAKRLDSHFEQDQAQVQTFLAQSGRPRGIRE